MTDLPDMKIKAVPVFPASVDGGTGIDITREGGEYTVDIDYSEFLPPVTVLPDASNSVLVWNSATDQYALAPVTIFGGASPSDAIPIVDGTPGTSGISPLYARGDHVHPSDTTRAPLTSLPAANVIINGDFRINQGGYVSGAVLVAGAYGHDQWKAGAGGGDYTFTQLKSSTQITIASGKSLIQPIEDVNVAGGSCVLSWTGTAQARAGVNTLTPAGAYAASPLAITGQTAGTVMSVEFNTGTLGTVKLERGTVATSFVMGSFERELIACERYYEKSFNTATVPANGLGASFAGSGVAFATNNLRTQWVGYRQTKRAAATITFFSDNNAGAPVAGQWNYYNAGWAAGAAIAAVFNNEAGFEANFTGTMTVDRPYLVSGGWVANARL